jgi:hypothetical protein
MTSRLKDRQARPKQVMLYPGVAVARFSNQKSFVLKLLVSGTLLVLVLRSVDLQDIRSQLSGMQGGRLAVLLLAHWLAQAMTAQRWRLVSRALGLKGSYADFFRMHFAGMFFSIGLPSLIGGDAVKALWASRQSGRPLSDGIASVLQDRAIGLSVLLSYGTAAAFLYPLKWHGMPLPLFYLTVWAGAAALTLAVWRSERISRRWLRPGTASLAGRALHRLAEFHRALAVLRLAPGAAVQALLLSLCNSAIVILIVQQVCVAVRERPDTLGVASVVPIADVLMMIPISLSGIGIRESAYVQLLPLLGMTVEGALAVALSCSALIVLRNLAGLLFISAFPAARVSSGAKNETG